MRERGDSLGLALKPGQRPSVLSKVFGQDLDRNLPIQACVLGSINFPHSTGTQRSDDLIRTELCSSVQRHGVCSPGIDGGSRPIRRSRSSNRGSSRRGSSAGSTFSQTSNPLRSK